ncbi:outer membrane protein OmpA [Hydrogenophaga sp. SL48]|uniref:outer membrane protein OmpA n=1 Tax=Hydrogenophaga sp. SL48 TaxID=2806347 RepID=UPI001F1FBE8E|nr:OmpA family protein [Hydrogenophaga sp. SL48]UJW79382.1 OmpA family protein [Hydrogenophaga sp. SL48]
MNKHNLNRMALLVASVTLASAAAAQTVDNWTNGGGDLVWRNGSNELCWRNNHWTPATAHPDCDGAIKPLPPVAAAPAPAPEPAPAPAPAPPAPVVVAPAPVMAMTLQAGTLFDFDKSVIKPAGKAALDGLVADMAKVDVETVIAVGHTDAIGTDTYNRSLSIRRVEAVKAYLVSKGVPADRIKTEGKGESQPVASNQTRDGRAQNRRVEIEVVGTQKP